MTDPIKLFRLYCTLPGGYVICHTGAGKIPDREETGIIVHIIHSGRIRGTGKLVIPSMEWLQAEGFSNAEMRDLKRFVTDNAEIIAERARTIADEVEDANAALAVDELLTELNAKPIYDTEIFWSGYDLDGDRLYNSYDYAAYDEFSLLDRHEKTQELRNLAAAMFYRRHGAAVFAAANECNVPMWWSTVEIREDETTLYSETLYGEDLIDYIHAISLALCEEMLDGALSQDD